MVGQVAGGPVPFSVVQTWEGASGSEKMSVDGQIARRSNLAILKFNGQPRLRGPGTVLAEFDATARCLAKNPCPMGDGQEE